MSLIRGLALCLAFALPLSVIPAAFAEVVREKNAAIDLTDDRYAVSENVVAVTVGEEAVNTVKAAVFGANNGYRAGGYGIYDEKAHAFNQAMLKKIRESGITHIREPGGIEGEYFHWNETIGPMENRVGQVNPFSRAYPSFTQENGELYDVAFGPEEWIELCKLTGISLTIQLNAGTGTPQEAADFIRYCLDSGVAIESIAVGNEVCMAEERVEGISVTCGPEEYIAFYNEVLSLMGEETLSALRERGIPFGCIGVPASHPLNVYKTWDADVLSGIAAPADFIDIHIAYSPYNVNLDKASAEKIHKCLLASADWVHTLLEQEIKTIAESSANTGIKMSEYGPLGSSACYGTAGALYLASFFQEVLRQEKVVSADYLPLCYNAAAMNSLIGADTANDLYWDNVVGYVFRMYAEQIGRQTLSVSSEGAKTFNSSAIGLMPRIKNVAEGDAAVYYDPETGAGSLFVINKAYAENTRFEISLPFARAEITAVTELWNEDYSLANTADNPAAVTPVSHKDQLCEVTDGRLTVSAKPVSLIRIDFSTAE